MRTMTVSLSVVCCGALAMTCLTGTCAWADVSVGIDPTNKHAWTENAGWANFAPSNGGITVHFDGTSGYLTGYAWGENIGWIKLGGNAGGPYNNTSATDWGVNLSAAGNLSGYAWGENVGWINFNPAYGGVMLNTTDGRFSAAAWGENIGWITFRGSASNYTVRTLAFDTQAQGTPNWWLTYYSVAENYDDGDGVPAWAEYVADTDPTNGLSYLYIMAISNQPSATVYFPSSSRRYYTLQRRDDLQVGGWSNVAGRVNIQGLGEVQGMQDTNVTTRQFYRIEVKVSP